MDEAHAGRTYRTRSIESRLVELSRQFPVLLLTGPRQVGKTTLLRHLAGDERTYVTLDDRDARELATRDPRLFFQRFPLPILIDEVQYAPELFGEIKIQVDQGLQPGAFWLTGSQRFQAMQRVSETLAGRVGIVELLGYGGAELLAGVPARGTVAGLPSLMPGKSLFEHPVVGPNRLDAIFERLWLGDFPALHEVNSPEPEIFWSSYLQTYLERDVRDLAAVKDLGVFTRFLRAIAARTGSLLNYSNLARDADVSVPTAKSWLSIIEATGLVLLVEPWHTNLTKRLVKTPKLYFLETGLASHLTGWTTARAMSQGQMAGAYFETHVVAEILKTWRNDIRVPRIYFYRDKDQKEIDLLLEQDGRLHPIEIKLTASPRPDHLAAFRTLERLPVEIGDGALICLAESAMPLTERHWAVPVGAVY